MTYKTLKEALQDAFGDQFRRGRSLHISAVCEAAGIERATMRYALEQNRLPPKVARAIMDLEARLIAEETGAPVDFDENRVFSYDTIGRMSITQ